jgi:hypothetical protein
LRKFTVYAELKPVIFNLDIFAQVGANAANIKEVKNVSVNDGILDIHLADNINIALLSGIVITPSTTGLIKDDENTIKDFKVDQNYPNPFNGKTIINYFLESPDDVSFQLYNILGEQVFYKNLGFKLEGEHKYIFDIAEVRKVSLTSGVYFYTLSASQKKDTRKLVLLN